MTISGRTTQCYGIPHYAYRIRILGGLIGLIPNDYKPLYSRTTKFDLEEVICLFMILERKSKGYTCMEL